MQSPLTPQRGRIESNPREYTHMGPRFCSELKAMLADRRPPAVLLPHKRGNPDARAWIIGHSPNKSGYSDGRARIFGHLSNESGYLDGICRKSLKNRPNIHARYPTVRKSSLVHHSRISRLSFVSNMRDDRKTREKYER